MDPVQSWLDAKEVRRMAESLMTPAPETGSTTSDAGYGDDFEGFANFNDDETPAIESENLTIEKTENPEAPTVINNELQREIVGSALADARKMAEGSGMLQESHPLSQPAESTPPPAVPTQNSPFQISLDQSECEPVPIATQIHESKPIEEPPANEFPQTETTTTRGPFLARLQKFSIALRRELEASAMFLIDSEGQILLDEVENPKLIQVARTLANASYAASRQTPNSSAVGNLHVKIGARSTLEIIPTQSRYGLLILGVIFPAPIGSKRVQEIADSLAKAIEPTS